MKKTTKQKHDQIINSTMHHIYKYISTDINLDHLASDLGVSKFYLHRIFKQHVGVNLYATIKSIRLQKASNLLITNKMSTITEIANMCGYSSQTSFIRAFKERFNQTPTYWKHGGYKEYSNKILNSSESASLTQSNFDHIEPEVSREEKKHIYYIRKRGYNKELAKTWQKLYIWLLTNNIDEYEQIAVYHDNPIITPFNECHYIAGISIKSQKLPFNTALSSLEIPAGVYAIFNVSGEYGDILKFIQWVYHEWLPTHELETTPNPAYSIFEKNHFLSDDEKFKLKFYLPIQYV